MPRDQFNLYFNVVLGAIGTILIAIAGLKVATTQDKTIYFWLFAGLILVINYINYLEKKAVKYGDRFDYCSNCNQLSIFHLIEKRRHN